MRGRHLGYLVLFIWVAVSAGTARSAEFIVSAAASLTQVMQAEAAAFSRHVPDPRAILNLGASGSLVQQMRHGAPTDVFVSASRRFMDRAVAIGTIRADAPRMFAGNTMVLAVPKNRAGTVRRLSDLEAAGVRFVAVGNPETVPAGRYAREILAAAGLWEVLGPKRVMANSARQVLDYLRRGEVDAGVVYATDVAAVGAVTAVESLPPVTPIEYMVAVTVQGSATAGGPRFMAFLLGPEGRRILRDYGFWLPSACSAEISDGH